MTPKKCGMQLAAYSSADSPCHWQASSKQFQKMCNYVLHSVVLILSAVEVFQGWGSAWAEVVKEAS